MTEPFQRLRRFLRELKRRNVYKVAGAYLAVAFVVWQAANLLFPALRFPGWTVDFVIVLTLLGFPLTLVLAWAFEMTAEGVRRTPELHPAEERSSDAGQRLSTGYKVLVGLGLIAAAVAAGWYLTGGGQSTTNARLGKRSVAVLPFEALGQKQPDTFTDGMHDALLARLSNVSGLKVISRTAVEPYRGSDKTTGEIARELGVRWVLEGGVQEMGEQIQVNAQLIDPRTETHAWAETYRRDLTAEDLFALQSEITKKIARSLEAELTPKEQRRVEGEPTESLEAYRFYVQGRNLLDQRTASSIDSARDYFRRALRQDSTFALAWAGLADARVLYPQYANVDSLPAMYDALIPAIPEAKQAARRALELDSDLAEAHTSLGYAYLLDLQGPAALAELRRAIELRPSYSQAQDWLGGLLLSLGRPRAALRHLELAVDLNPENQNAPRWLNEALVANGRYEDALKHGRRRRKPEWEALALLHLKRWTAMRQVARQALERDEATRSMQAYLAVADLAAGDTASALRRRDELSGDNGLTNPIPLGLVHAALGEDATAVATLGRIFDGNGDLPPPHLGHLEYFQLRYHYPGVFGPLRNDPRYQELIREASRAWGLNPDGSLPDSVDVSFASQADD